MASSSVAAPNRPNFRITSPLLHDKFYISPDAVWPSLTFQTDAEVSAQAEITWNWLIEWGCFSSRGQAQTSSPCWEAHPVITNLGGLLTVEATQSGDSGGSCSVQVHILGTQPQPRDVERYVAAQKDCTGFEKILMHETRMKHFDASGFPVKSFDGGYGMAQLTNPVPKYDLVWNWKLNVDAALKLFSQKRAEAIAYLSRKGNHTERQLLYETVSRWNGGSYHLWDAQHGWIRKPAILCDSQTGNIGWNMTELQNIGKTEEELHHRDSGCYSRPPRPGDPWGYFGVCYADSVLGV